MITKEKTKYLEDKVASIIFIDESTQEYVECIVSSALNIKEGNNNISTTFIYRLI